MRCVVIRRSQPPTRFIRVQASGTHSASGKSAWTSGGATSHAKAYQHSHPTVLGEITVRAEACLSTAANASPWPPSIARGESVVGPPRQTWPLNHCGFVKRTKPPRQRRGPKNDQFVDAFRSQRLSSCRHVRCRPRSDGRLRAFTFSARRRHQEE